MSAEAAVSTEPALSSLLVVVGTDHHPFDRVVRWTDDWLSGQHPQPSAVVQHGTSRPPRLAEGHELLAHHEVRRLMATASLVVTHGGPATIMDVRRSGRVPVVVARDPGLGEHVDDHQQRFCRRMAQQGRIVLCETYADFTAALDRGRRDPLAYALQPHDQTGTAQVQQAVERVGAVVDELITDARRRRRCRRFAPRRSGQAFQSRRTQ